MLTMETRLEEKKKFYNLYRQLYGLDFDIAMLKRWVEEAGPYERAKFLKPVRSLSKLYQSVETRMQALEESRAELTEEELEAIKNALEQLQAKVESTGRLIWLKMDQKALATH